MLTPEQLKAREGKLTASAIGYLVSGDSGKIYNLWRELIGDPDYKRENLCDVWPVQLGNATEELQLDWYERKTHNEVTRRGEVVVHPQVTWAACTLDGWIENLRCPLECKHVGGWESFDKILARYSAQCQWQMDVTGADICMFSVIEGAKPPRLREIEYDGVLSRDLWKRAHKFMQCVRTLTPPEM